jgi:hypothetical protein
MECSAFELANDPLVAVDHLQPVIGIDTISIGSGGVVPGGGAIGPPAIAGCGV